MKATVTVTAQIDDEMDVELPDGATDEEIIAAAHADWSFTEAHSWSADIIDRDDYDDAEGS